MTVLGADSTQHPFIYFNDDTASPGLFSAKVNKPKKQKQPLKAIREHCIECMGGRDNEDYLKQIKDCGSPDCSLYDFRFGKNPFHTKQLTDEQRKVKADQLKTSVSIDKIS